MRRFFKAVAVAVLGLLLTLCVHAESGDIAGRIYTTDITATVNGIPVDSYNIGGKTVIILEDLQRIGAEVSYNDSLRTLIVNTLSVSCAAEHEQEPAEKSGQQAGVPVGNIYESDIVTFLNGEPVRTYSLNGKMAAVVEEIGLAGEHGWSKYNAACKWLADKRRIELEFLTSSAYSVTDMEIRKSLGELLDSKKARLVCHIDRVYLEKSVVPSGMSMVRTDDGEIYVEYAMPVSLVMEHDGKDAVVGKLFKAKNKHFLIHDDGTVSIEDGGETLEAYYDYTAIYEIAKLASPFTFTRQELVGHFTGGAFFATVISRIDLDECTFLNLYQPTPHGSNQLLIRIAADGTWRNYAESFESVSLWGTKTFDEVTVNAEHKTVTFGYDKWYKIDLVTGILTELSQKP